MAKFKMVSQRFLCKQAVLAFRNVVQNYEASISEDDFFDIVDVGFDHDAGLVLIEDAYTSNELSSLENVRTRRGRLDRSESLKDIFRVLWNYGDSREKCKAVLRGICDYTIRDIGRIDRDDVYRQRLSALKRTFGLSRLECSIMTVAYAAAETCFEWPCRCSPRQRPLLYAMAVNHSLCEVSAALSAKGRLRRFGVLNNRFDFNERLFGGFMDGTETEAVERRFYQKSEMREVLPWEYYGEMARKDGETMKRIISAGGPCNILFYGAPGTGKTSFAHSLVKELGRTGFEIRQGDADGRNMRADARMAGIQMCNEQEDAATSVVVVDEADELLRSSVPKMSALGLATGGKTMEKGVVNSILDEIRIPTIWISNMSPESIDESVRRRFDYSVKFNRLNRSQRMSIWRNLVSRNGLSHCIGEEKIRRYAEDFDTSAGGISTVLANAKRIGVDSGTVDEVVSSLMKPHCQLMGIESGSHSNPTGDYSLEGLNINGGIPLERIVEAVRGFRENKVAAAALDQPRMNILLWGPPGTGKTEFVKHLGKELDCKVAVKMGSDLLSMWVGGTEKNIREAFEEAESDKAILFLDEIDGIVQDRTGAQRDWEVTKVNELLHRMENFNGVMVAATNFMDNLDAAIMRRFTFKIQFDYLDDDGKRLFFERMFGTRLADAEATRLAAIPNLTPGDFRTVRQSLYYLGGSASNETLLNELEKESALKKCSRNRIGF